MPSCTLEGNRIESLVLLGAVECKSSINFYGTVKVKSSINRDVTELLVWTTHSLPYLHNSFIHYHTFKMIVCNEENHHAANIGAVLALMATGGGVSHLKNNCSVLLHLLHYLKQWLANSCYLEYNRWDSYEQISKYTHSIIPMLQKLVRLFLCHRGWHEG